MPYSSSILIGDGINSTTLRKVASPFDNDCNITDTDQVEIDEIK